jgi:hypothetical protein
MTVFGTLRRFSGGDRARLYDFRRRREDPGEHPRGRLRGRSGHQALSIAETASLGARRAPATSQRGQQGNALHRDSPTGMSSVARKAHLNGIGQCSPGHRAVVVFLPGYSPPLAQQGPAASNTLGAGRELAQLHFGCCTSRSPARFPKPTNYSNTSGTRRS